MLSAPARQRGVTLVELMIAGVISLIALSAVLTLHGATARHSRLQLQSAHLHQQVLGALDLMARDLRRAGYWHFNPALQSPARNPFQTSGNRLRSGAFPGEAEQSCILLSYDLDNDGRVGVGQCERGKCPPASDDDNVEQFGFRLHRGTLQSRYGGERLACDAGYWQALNDPDIRVTQLRFAIHTHCIDLRSAGGACDETAAQVQQRVVSIQIGAQLRNDTASRIHLARWVAVRNDRLQAPPP